MVVEIFLLMLCTHILEIISLLHIQLLKSLMNNVTLTCDMELTDNVDINTIALFEWNKGDKSLNTILLTLLQLTYHLQQYFI